MTEEHPKQSIPPTGPFPSESSSLKGLTMALGIEPAQPGHDPLLGSVLGGVTIVRVIADGGMGRVYEGQQDKPRRAVAVKVIRPGFTSPSMARRFQYEAEVLGRLQHPGIAHIYAAAIHTVAGCEVPYFVMEYIRDAKTLTEYVTDLSLPMRARLELFRKVCQAVAHGHQKGVIHRDLKPTNILVDGAGQPKVIDFGVARATDSDMALTTMQTDVGQLIGTLQYMSPEQFEADPNNIDSRSDVYALGVILYEILAGQLPYDFKKKALLEVARVVRECEPTPISHLNKTLSRELGVIAGKCLQKDRGHRYSSAADLADELGRHLAGEPIMATPPRLWDSIVRLSRRHKTAAIAFTGIATSLLFAIIGISVFAVRAERAREDADRQRIIANRERAVAETARDAALQSQRSEAEQRTRAETETVKAKERLYSDDLRRLARAQATGPSAAFHKLYVNAIRNYRQIHGDQGHPPLALRLLGDLNETDALHVLNCDAVATAVAFSPDTKRLATAHRGGFVLVWDAVTGASIVKAKPSGSVKMATATSDTLLLLAFSSDGSQIVAPSDKGVVYIWDATTGALCDQQQALALSLAEPQRPSLGPQASLSLDGGRCAWAVTSHGEAKISVWDVFRKRQLGIVTVAMPESDLDASRPAFTLSPDGKRLVTATAQGIRLWDADTGAEQQACEYSDSLRMSRPHSGVFMDMEGRRVFYSLYDAIQCWDAETGKIGDQVSKTVHGYTLHASTPDATRFAMAHQRGGFIRIFDMPSNTALSHLRLGGAKGTQLQAAAFSRDGSRLATTHTDGAVRIWDTSPDESLTALVGHPHGISTIVFSADGSRIATGSLDGSIRLWDSTTYESLAVLQGPRSPVMWLAFNADGTRLATATIDEGRLWDAVTGEAVAVLKENEERVGALTFSPTGGLLATSSSDQIVRVWNATDGQCAGTLKGHRSEITSLTFSNTHPRLATSTFKGPVGLWETATWQPIALINDDQGPIKSLAFSPTQPLLATASKRGTRLWDAVTGAARGAIPNSASEQVTFSPNGLRLASRDADRRIMIWDMSAWALIATTPEPDWSDGLTSLSYLSDASDVALVDLARADLPLAGPLLEELSHHRALSLLEYAKILAFSPDSSLLAIGGPGRSLELWDAIDGYVIAELPLPPAATSVAYHPEGLSVAVCSPASNTARIYGVKREEIKRNRAASQTLRASLTPTVEEWFGGGLASVKAKLKAASATMLPEECREAGNMVLMRGGGNRRDPL
jgi:WD40 repeat protein/serine/threonine protein kinase